MISLLIPILCFLSISLALAVLLKKRLNQTFFLTVILIIFILYFAGLMNFQGSLLVGYTLIFLLSIASLVFLLIRYLKDKKIFKNVSVASGVILFFVFLGISLYLNYGRMYSLWDEFSYWGAVVKHMYIFDALSTYKESFLLIKDYLPGIPLFNYFWTRAFPVFTEYPSYVGVNMLFFSVILAFVKKINFSSIVFVLTFFLIPLIMGARFYSSLYVDALLGILLGSTLLFYYKYDYEKSLYGILGVIALIFLMVITKDMGVIFSGIAIFIIVADILFFKRRKLFKKIFLNKKLTVFLILLPILFCFLGYFSWKLHIDAVSLDETPKTTQIDIGKFLRNDLDEHQKEVTRVFKSAIFEKGFYPVYPLANSVTFQLILLYALFSFVAICVFSNLRDKRREIVLFLGIIFGAGIYLVILYLSYLFIFEPWEAVRIASYERYVFSYGIAMLTSFLFFLTVKPKPFPKSIVRRMAICILIVSFWYWLVSNSTVAIKSDILNARSVAQWTMANREGYSNILRWSDEINADGEKLYTLVQQSKGDHKLILMHTLYPSRLEWIKDYSVNIEPYYPEWIEDPWTTIMLPNEWAEYIVENYTLVYVFEYDDQFLANYGHFFEDLEQHMLYRVVDDEENILHLVKLEKDGL
jgi:hypothetical protein